jgi:hypothetical protein
VCEIPVYWEILARIPKVIWIVACWHVSMLESHCTQNTPFPYTFLYGILHKHSGMLTVLHVSMLAWIYEGDLWQ